MKLIKIMLYDSQIYTAPSSLAKDYRYSNASSGLTSVNVQDAIDELANNLSSIGGGSGGGSGSSNASDIKFDNSLSGLSSDNVQNAIGELAYMFNNSANVQYDNSKSGLASTNIKDAIDELKHMLSDYISSAAVPECAGYSNSIYRGKNITSKGLDAIYESIKNGKFSDMYVGDIITVSLTIDSVTSNVDFLIAGFNLFSGIGSSAFAGNHITLIPKGNSIMTASAMNSTDITTGGYVGSKMYTTVLPKLQAALEAAFGDKLIGVEMKLSNSVTGGVSDGVSDFIATKVKLLSEMELLGTIAYSNIYDNITSMRQFPIFRLSPETINAGNYWLSSVASDTEFCAYNGNGHIDKKAASSVLGVRPYFNIGFMN